MSRVFISYAREDEEIARRVRADLSAQGIGTWLDKEDLLPGEQWKIAIGDAIRNSSHFLALISRHSVGKRGFIQRELLLGLEIFDEVPPNQIFLIPVRIHDVTPSHHKLSRLQWVDLWPSYEQAMSRVILAITGKKTYFDSVLFLRIVGSIDRNRDLCGGGEAAVKELTKRLLFYIVREVFYFPFQAYRQFIDWLRSEGYQIPQELTFQDSHLYDMSLAKVERLNRIQIDAMHVDAVLLFSEDLPLRVDGKR